MTEQQLASSEIIYLLKEILSATSNPLWQQSIMTFGSAFFGAAVVFCFERYREARKETLSQIQELLNFFHINAITIGALLEHKIHFLFYHHELIEEIKQFIETALSMPMGYDFTLMENHFRDHLWRRVEAAASHKMGGVAILQERWEKTLFPKIDLKQISFVSKSHSSIIHIYLRSISCIQALEVEIVERDKLWTEYRNTLRVSSPEPFRDHMLALKRLFLTRDGMLDMVNRAIFLSIATNALIEDCLLRQFDNSDITKNAIEVIDEALIPDFEPYIYYTGEEGNAAVIKWFAKKYIKFRPLTDQAIIN